MNEVEIVQLKPIDWEAYKNIRLEALKNDPDSFGSTYKNTVGKSSSFWKSGLDGSRGVKLFAKIDDLIVAMAGAYYEEEEGITNACIFGVYTTPRYRGRGISENILKELINKLDKEGVAKLILLHVNQGAQAAIRLYEKLGFRIGEPIEDHRRDDGNSFPQYLMSLSLT